MTWRSIENPPFRNVVLSQQEENSLAWQQLQTQLPVGTVLTGKVFTQAIFGVFYDAGVGFPVRMNITDFGKQTKHGMRFPDDYPPLNSTIKGRLLGFDNSTYQLVVGKLDA
ncbi:hypothetical protein [Hymenobacter sp. BT730]|uniref:hypothetical protein n=1 Tax=Hymenobacter sp. BT730 TaxID=3063332 RepID=UPI0026DEE214|nr:hypothetical protein [Hymenobacter sp. BT730]